MSRKTYMFREFIHYQLYNSQNGYFIHPDNVQVGQLKNLIPFNDLLGLSDFSNIVLSEYPKNAFLTPSEIFKPFYGMTVANMIHKLHLKKNNFQKEKLRHVIGKSFICFYIFKN